MRSLAIFIPLFLILGVAVWAGVRMWSMMEGAEISGHGYAAMALGIVGSLLVGGGLMALVFHSSRRGYDEGVRYGSPDDHPEDDDRT